VTAISLFESVAADAVLVQRAGKPVTRGQLVWAAQQVATTIAGPCINLCASRSAFIAGLLAAASRQQLTLLPPTQAPEALARLQRQYPGCHVLSDAHFAALDWHNASEVAITVESGATALVLFTSGTSGEPRACEKSWSSLLQGARLDSARLVPTQGLNIVATVPPQHMYGLQTSILMPLVGAVTVHDGLPFYPADIRQCLEEVAVPRALVATPLQLQACMDSQVVLPELSFVLSATAPMPHALATAIEQRWCVPLVEIYGSTEIGTIGTRRLTHGQRWRLLPGMHLARSIDDVMCHGEHLAMSQPLNDDVEIHADGEFELRGRHVDQIKVAGKRASLIELTAQLRAVPGVRDAVIFLPPGAQRTAALAVAPGWRADQLSRALARFVDAAFLPRPLLLLTQLPRNPLGKLMQADLLAALEEATGPKPVSAKPRSPP
jgi:acyl-coenzyme A synthetase/AMP-(fatty) acid ligase